MEPKEEILHRDSEIESYFVRERLDSGLGSTNDDRTDIDSVSHSKKFEPKKDQDFGLPRLRSFPIKNTLGRDNLPLLQRNVAHTFDSEYACSSLEHSELSAVNNGKWNEESDFGLLEGTIPELGCDESDINFRSRTDSGFGSFSECISRGGSSKRPNKSSGNFVSSVSGSLDQSNSDALTKAKLFTDEGATGDKSISSMTQCLQLSSPDRTINNIDSHQPYVVIEQAGIVSISFDSLKAQGFSSESSSSSAFSVPNVSVIGCGIDENVEEGEPNTAVPQSNHKKSLIQVSQHNDLVSKIEIEEGRNVYFIFKRAGVVVMGNNSTINLGDLNSEELSKDCNVKFTISQDALHYIVKNDPRNVPGALRLSGSIAGKRYKYIMECMKKYQDSGLTQELEKFSSAMLRRFKKDEVDLRIVILLERALYLIYQKNLEDAKNLIDEATEIAKSAENASLLLGRCYIFRAHVLLYEKKYNETLTCLNDAASFLENVVSGEDKAFCCYLFGCTYLKMTDEATESHSELEAKALEYFEKEIQHAREDPEPRVLIKKMHYSLFKQISVHLRTYSENSKKLPVEEKRIEKANHLLNHFDDFYYDDAPPGTRVHYFALKSDYFFRKKRFDRAVRILKGDGLETARSVGHMPLLQMVDARMNFLTQFEEKIQDESTHDVTIDIDGFDELEE